MKTLILNESINLQFPHDLVESCNSFYDVEIKTSDENDFLLNVRGKAIALISQKRYGFYMLSGHKFEPPDWWPTKEIEVEENLPFFSCIKALFKGQPITRFVKKVVYVDFAEFEGYYRFTIPVSQIKVIEDQ